GDRQVGAIAIQVFQNEDMRLLRERIRQTAADAGFPDRRVYSFGRGEYLTCAIGRLRKRPSDKLMERLVAIRGLVLADTPVNELRLVEHAYFFTPETARLHA